MTRGKFGGVRLAVLLAWTAVSWSPGAHSAPNPSSDCGTVVLGASPAALSLHPVLDQSITDQQVTGLLYRPLVWMNGTGDVDAEGSLASTITPNADSTSFTIRMKPWHWSDRNLIDADDVLYDWSLIRQAAAMGLYDGSGGVPDLVRAVRRIDDRTVAIDLRRSVNREWFIKDGLDCFTPLPRRHWQATPFADQRNRVTDPAFFDVVDGAMRVAEMVPGRYAAFVPNPRYDGHHPAMRRLVMDFLTPDYPLDALREGQVDAAYAPSALLDRLARLPDFTLFTRPPVGFKLMVLNLNDPASRFLQDVRVRQALARAIDQRRFIEVVLHGHGTPTHGILTTDQAQALPPELRDGRTPLDYDPAAARVLLDQAGYRPDADGIRIRFQLLAATIGNFVLAAQILQDDLSRVGVAMSITTMDPNAVLAKVREKRGWAAYLVGIGAGGPYPDVGGLWATGAMLGTHDRHLDDLIAQSTTAQGPDALYALQRDLMDTQPSLFLPVEAGEMAVRKELTGLDRAFGFSMDFMPERLQLHGSMACDGAHG